MSFHTPATPLFSGRYFWLLLFSCIALITMAHNASCLALYFQPHFVNSAKFAFLRSPIPKPPYFLGLIIVFHAVQTILFFSFFRAPYKLQIYRYP
ncbi:hypothetical protein HanRHA438_Chr17g0841741 [Helianthus annuus]|nr:hypothetical protein HanRHA438_Chr17g0841741 [Helianthus annuus]